MQTYEKENAIVTACIGSFKKIFSRFIDAEDLLLKENLTGEESGEAVPGHRPRPNLKIFLFPLTRPCFTGMGWSVGILLTSQIEYPLNLIVYSKTCLKKNSKKDDQLSHNAGQKFCRMLPGSILQYFPLSFNLQVLLYSPTIGNKIKYTNNSRRI